MDCLLNFMCPDNLNLVAKFLHQKNLADCMNEMLANNAVARAYVSYSIAINGVCCWYSHQNTNGDGSANLCVFYKDLTTGVGGYRPLEVNEEYDQARAQTLHDDWFKK